MTLASVADVLVLLSREFVVLVALAFGVAAPVAYVVLHRWLETFAYQVEWGIGVLALAGGLVLLVALLTVGVRAFHAALRNPVESLRYESEGGDRDRG